MAKHDATKSKVLLWDIEASDLSADFGYVFCIGWKWLGVPGVNLISIRDYPRFKKDCTDDSLVLKEFAKVMEKADMHVTWYGARFDLPFINTRAMMNGMDPMPLVPHVDAWRIARYQLKFTSNRLDTVSRNIPVVAGEKRELKTAIDGRHWVRGKAGYADSIKYIETHCIADIRVLEKVYLEIRKYANAAIPNLSKVGGVTAEGCPTCGSDEIQSRGYSLTARGNKRRYQCQSCAHWFSLPVRIK